MSGPFGGSSKRVILGNLRTVNRLYFVSLRDLYTSVPVAPPSDLPSAFRTRSGGGSDRCFFSGCVSEPAVSSVSSTTVLGMGIPPGGDFTSSLRGCEGFSGMMAISSGSASSSLLRYASVPGTSPYDGSSLTFSTLVLGMGEFL